MYFIRILTFFGLFLAAVDVSSASCWSVDADRILNDYETVFVAFLKDGQFVDGESSKDCGWIEGSFDVVEELQGRAESVTVVRRKLNNCNGRRIGGSSDRYPIGKYFLVTTNTEEAWLGDCTYIRDDQEMGCLVDNMRRRLDIEAVNAEQRDFCVRDEMSRGELRRSKSIREYIDRLERDRQALDIELEELRGMLEKSGSSE